MDLSFPTICFYLFSAILVFAGLRVITARNPVHAVLHLVLAFFTSGMIWMLMQAEFLAIAIVLIYVGAVMVLFLFVVMMLDINIDKMREGFWRYLPVGLVVAGIMVAEMAMVLNGRYFSAEAIPAPAELDASASNTQALARLIFTDYAYPFELASLVLLVAMIAAVMLTYRRRESTRHIDPAKQIAVKARDRLVIHAIAAEKEEVTTGTGDSDK
ncbi:MULTISPECIES: NADH-quinone oxidoreductase subunit J [unclassified Uliginosibacterium]|uniref:NADH-quinone oxidoreductase subunit J n=1 Tax=unclassified Uliginosibacterium TaxID=2621521 RepID=UPI000C7D3657|nr:MULTISPECIES: NADH-quinone oxidoreductase subunit J [unclassified Uliginosibacterium]MDO6386830.1 NADH-quinone oxidoreductase subunit J [Uliginosibacterium sp. 31-12]PLK48264.1 NADH-quinone oxidoreductase subunit J [Uliginosibacterium sp. TH139]